tara:strand:+ start:1437 stop:3749 length:2313 start_codon:yes stop_codon:yes gene_type:complete
MSALEDSLRRVYKLAGRGDGREMLERGPYRPPETPINPKDILDKGPYRPPATPMDPDDIVQNLPNIMNPMPAQPSMPAQPMMPDEPSMPLQPGAQIKPNVDSLIGMQRRAAGLIGGVGRAVNDPTTGTPRDMFLKMDGSPMTEAERRAMRGLLDDRDPMDRIDPEARQRLDELLGKAQEKFAAPLGPIAEELAMQGMGEDTQLAHLRPGEIVMPPEFMEDAQFEAAVENKFNEFGLDPEKAVVGIGIASLNPTTGLEEFGFFKKLGKSLKKVVKKVAPVALPLLIPGVGKALSGGLSSLGSALGIPSGIGSSFLGGKGVLDTLGGIRGGIGSFFGGLGGGSTEQGGDQQQQSGGGFLSNLLGGGDGGGFMSGGGGGMSPLGMLGIGGLAAGLGKLAYEDAKKQTGVPLTPLTTMSPTGRYNIEAEIARRMGQQAPNPVEFGLLPQGTIPQLSGGKPLGSAAGGMGPGMMFEKPPVMAKSLGGAIEELQGGMARGMQEGGGARVRTGVVPGTEVRNVETTEALTRALESKAKNALETINSLEQKFNPNNPYDTIVSNLPFDPTAIENMLMSADKKAYEQAKEDFIYPFLRQQSGRVVTYDEIDYFDQTYFPQPGDNDATIRLKKMARDSLMDSFTKSLQDKAVKKEDKGIGSMKSMRSMKGMMYGGPVMAYAQGGAVQMQEGGEMDPSEFPRMDGDINGPGTETSDDIPAMLSDGEFVMTGRAVRGAGSYDMAMDPKGIISLIPSFEEDRERGMDLMYKMMDAFAANAESA